MSAHGCAHEVRMTIASYIGMVLRIMVLMADFTHILATRPDFTESDREWLHHLVADWQVIADLSFADLLLIVQDATATTASSSSAGLHRDDPENR